jgi:hypothetical protein
MLQDARGKGEGAACERGGVLGRGGGGVIVYFVKHLVNDLATPPQKTRKNKKNSACIGQCDQGTYSEKVISIC